MTSGTGVVSFIRHDASREQKPLITRGLGDRTEFELRLANEAEIARRVKSCAHCATPVSKLIIN